MGDDHAVEVEGEDPIEGVARGGVVARGEAFEEGGAEAPVAAEQSEGEARGATARRCGPAGVTSGARSAASDA